MSALAILGILAAVAAVILLGIALFAVLRVWLRLRARRQAAATFLDDADARERDFLAAANELGTPRGLRWIRCRLVEPVEFAEDLAGRLTALASAEIGFEAIPGGGMEEVEAVSRIRAATVVFVWMDESQVWATAGRAVMSLTPAEVRERFADELEPWSQAVSSPAA